MSTQTDEQRLLSTANNTLDYKILEAVTKEVEKDDYQREQNQNCIESRSSSFVIVEGQGL